MCLSSVLFFVNGQSVVMVTGRDRQLCLFARCVCVCVLTLVMCVFLSLRRGGGGGVPRGREGHGTAGGSGVRRGPDHPLCRHLLLTRPGHSVRQTPLENELKDGRRDERG